MPHPSESRLSLALKVQHFPSTPIILPYGLTLSCRHCARLKRLAFFPTPPAPFPFPSPFPEGRHAATGEEDVAREDLKST